MGDGARRRRRRSSEGAARRGTSPRPRRSPASVLPLRAGDAGEGYAVVKTRRTAAGRRRAQKRDPRRARGRNDSGLRFVRRLAAVHHRLRAGHAKGASRCRLGGAPAHLLLRPLAGERIGRGHQRHAGPEQASDGGRFSTASSRITRGPAAGSRSSQGRQGRPVADAHADQAAVRAADRRRPTRCTTTSGATSKRADWSCRSYLENKRNNARILRDKGLAPEKEQMYECAASATQVPARGRRGENRSRYVETDAEHSSTCSTGGSRRAWRRRHALRHGRRLGDANRDSAIENPGIAFPEVSCPLGVYSLRPPPRTTSLSRRSPARGSNRSIPTTSSST